MARFLPLSSPRPTARVEAAASPCRPISISRRNYWCTTIRSPWSLLATTCWSARTRRIQLYGRGCTPALTSISRGNLLPLTDDLKRLPLPFLDPAVVKPLSVPVVFALGSVPQIDSGGGHCDQLLRHDLRWPAGAIPGFDRNHSPGQRDPGQRWFLGLARRT